MAKKKKKKKRKAKTKDQQIATLERKVRKLNNLVDMGAETMKGFRGDCGRLRDGNTRVVSELEWTQGRLAEAAKKEKQILGDYHYAAARLLVLEHEKRNRSTTINVKAAIVGGMPESDKSPE